MTHRILASLAFSLAFAGSAHAFTPAVIYGSSGKFDKSFNEAAFQGRISAALKELKTILDQNRNPVLAESVPHEFVGKFRLSGKRCAS